ncbi:phage Gp37/Gp68 family protein (plasmid) [Burkholderia cenocepacia]|uniref:DUF5131 family protein n=1 Tax=Burkholderia cenocepacia TaxID=95486 RepID=UPI0020A1269D|nr:phage Gp37/Gp68 family protein [Burkholderia cenocepacia]MCO8402777.1 DUF5131 family protein [Burkholderia cenocepacia]MCO8415113.1 DUF5131 family protein [Burkholderia cenocepacia]MCO8423088.1 DUF5131 family protein [Burkholderia cenocepacia]MCO8474763.1 DUF5131 family protein [Burkholderia cenocepacia]MCO8482057.1 DUF5131 family protein [Burkholderia cenocepacia]
MAENTRIEWCDHTFNPFFGCTKVSPGCEHCYAEQLMDKRMHRVVWGAHGDRVRTSAANWNKPLRWNAQPFVECGRCGCRGALRRWLGVPTRVGMTHCTQCPGCGGFDCESPARPRVFCASLGDVFDNAVDPAWREDLFALIAATPSLDWLMLTKRIGNVATMLRQIGVENLPNNVWLGATIVNQTEADREIPKLLALPARVHFLSMEPLLSQVDIRRWLAPHCERHPGALEPDGKCGVCEGRDIWGVTDHELLAHEKAPIRQGLDWVIVGGESGSNARPMHPDWVRSLRDQCAKADVPFFFKQWGEWHTDAFLMSTGEPVFRQFTSFQQWVSKALTWVNGGICLDRHGNALRIGADFMRARDAGDFPVTIMHRVGKHAAGRVLDGVMHHVFPDTQTRDGRALAPDHHPNVPERPRHHAV